MKFILMLVLAWVFNAQAASVNHGNYVLTHTVSDRNQFSVASSNYGAWAGYITTSARRHGNRHRVSFEFWSPSFFSDGNIGHIAVGVHAASEFQNGDLSTLKLNGRGVIIGNVSQYNNPRPGCPGTTHRAAVAIETWWRDGAGQQNCVMGWTQSPPLLNNQLYRLSITSFSDERGAYVGYTLEEWRGSGWVLISDKITFDYTPAQQESGGIFILEVFSDHVWQFHINNLTEEALDDI